MFLPLHVKPSADEAEQLVTYALAEIRDMMIKGWDGEAWD